MNNPPDFIQLSIRQFWQILKMDYQSQTDNASPVWKRPIVTLLLIIPFYLIKDLDPILNITESQCWFWNTMHIIRKLHFPLLHYAAEKISHFALKILLHFASMLFHFELVLHFWGRLLHFALVLQLSAILIRFCASITVCGDSYYMLHLYYSFRWLLHFAAMITFCVTFTFCGDYYILR